MYNEQTALLSLSYGMYGGEHKCIRSFGEETKRKEAICKAKTWIRE